MASVTDPGIVAAYQSAASVQSQTGVSPVIVATILSTEGGSTPGSYSLGITTLAPGGRGSSGIVLPSSNNFGGTQPSAFWGYQTGAEAAQALAGYLKSGPPGIQALAQFANDPSAFFAAGPPIYASGTPGNYYVPTQGEASAHGGMLGAVQYYWGEIWGKRAGQLASMFSEPFNPSPGGVLGGSVGATPVGPPTPPGTPRTPGEANPGAFDTHSLINPNFGPSLVHVLISVGLIALAIVLFIGGIMLLNSDKVEAVVSTVEKGAASAAT